MSFDFRWIDPDYRELVASHRLDDLETVLALRAGQRVAADRHGRDTLLLSLPGPNGQTRDFYLKRERTARPKAFLEQLAVSGGFWTAARAEFAALRELAAAGIRGPRPVACLERGPFPAQGCLLLEEAAAGQTLGVFLAATLKSGDPQPREAFFAVLGREVARLHASGFHHPEMYSNHVRVLPRGDNDWNISFSDLRHSTRHRKLSRSRRAADLAALWATLSPRVAGAHDREVFFDAYLARSSWEDQAIEFLAQVDHRVQELLTRRKIWEIRESDTEEHRNVHSLESVDTGKMWIDRDYRAMLDQAGLTKFELVMATTAGRLIRALPDRENWRLELQGPQGEPRGAYLKKHHVRGLRSWWRATIGAGPGKTAGRVEARNAARLARSGIAAMRLIAYGEKLHADGLLESFVLTEELAGFEQLDHFLRRRFPPVNGVRADRPGGEPQNLEPRNTEPRNVALSGLIRDVAAVAAKFHRLGYNHRDLYCCHFFIAEPQHGAFKVNLIDLQRVEHRRRFRWRWLVKDLAQLAYSAPRDRITCKHKLAFIKHYLGVKKLRPEDKRLIGQVLAKQRLMERNLGAHP